MNRFALLTLAILAATSCAGLVPEGADEGKPDSGSAALPAWDMKVKADIVGAIAGIDSQTISNPTTPVQTDDLQSVSYSASAPGNGSATASLIVTRNERSVRIESSASVNSPGQPSAMSGATIELRHVCVAANGATSFRIDVSCAGTAVPTGSSASAELGIGKSSTGCHLAKVLFQGSVLKDTPWDRTSFSFTVPARTDAPTCWTDGVQVHALSTAGQAGAGNASAATTTADVTLTVTPIY